MKLFILKIIKIFLIPLMVFAYILFVAINQNLFQYDKVILNSNFLIGEPFNDNFALNFKYAKNITDTKILAIGSSRVLQIKSDYFYDSFFNLCYLVNNPRATKDLIESKDINNKKLIVSIDQWIFNKSWNGVNNNFQIPQIPNFFQAAFNSSRIYSIGNFKTYPTFKSSSRFLKFGAGANMALEGFINDGSFYYGKRYHGLLNNQKKLIGEDFKFEYTINQIKNGTGQFVHGQSINEQAILDLEELIVSILKKRNDVTLFFPPFAPTIQNYLDTEEYMYLQNASFRIKQLAKKYKIDFFDFTNYPSSDSMFIDGFHGGAKLYYLLLQEMGFKLKKLSFSNNFELTSDSILIRDRKNFFRY